jgi:hypothetical protein
MNEQQRLSLIEKAKKGVLKDKAGNKIGPDHPSLQKKEEATVVLKDSNYDDINKAISLISKSLDESKELHKKELDKLLEAQKDIVKSTEKSTKDLIDTIKNDKPAPVVIKEETKSKKLERWEFIHKRDKSGKLVSTIAKQLR